MEMAILVAVGACARGRDYQRLADDATWEWEPERAALSYSIGRANCDYVIELIQPKKAGGIGTPVVIRFTDAGRLAFSYTGSVWTVFVVDRDTVYYADFSPIRTGCAIVAFDLNGGKEVWRTDLAGLGGVTHSRYSNRVVVSLEEGALKVLGNEERGKYLEYVDLRTGKTLAHRIFEKK